MVSDEEVIEDAHFTSDKFKTQADTLYLPLAEMLTVPKKQSNEESEISSIYKTVTRTNQILAKYSPVLLIQKTVRGFFARKFKRYLVENRIWIPQDIMDDDKEIREVSDLDTSAPPAPPLVEQKSENIESNKGDNSRPGKFSTYALMHDPFFKLKKLEDCSLRVVLYTYCLHFWIAKKWQRTLLEIKNSYELRKKSEFFLNLI